MKSITVTLNLEDEIYDAYKGSLDELSYFINMSGNRKVSTKDKYDIYTKIGFLYAISVGLKNKCMYIDYTRLQFMNYFIMNAAFKKIWKAYKKSKFLNNSIPYLHIDSSLKNTYFYIPNIKSSKLGKPTTLYIDYGHKSFEYDSVATAMKHLNLTNEKKIFEKNENYTLNSWYLLKK